MGCCRCGGSSLKKRKPKITVRRLANFLDAYPWADWNERTARIFNAGIYGDKPGWKIKGKFEHLTLEWRSATPGGGYARLLVFKGKKKLASFRATYRFSWTIKSFVKDLARKHGE